MQFTMYADFSDRIALDGIEKASQCAVKAGFSSVEFLEYLIDDKPFVVPDLTSASRVKKELERQGLGIACYSAVANIWNDKTTYHAFKHALEIAAELGSPYFHHTLLPWLNPPADAPTLETGIKKAVEVAARVADYAKTLGIICIYEDQGRYINGVSGFGAFYWELKKLCSNVGVCGDFGNILFVNEKPEDFLAAFRNEIRHIHVKDYLLEHSTVSPGENWIYGKDDNWLCGTDIGTGIVNINKCMKLLKDIGYTGTYSIECIIPEPYFENTRRIMEYLRKIEESYDSLGVIK